MQPLGRRRRDREDRSRLALRLVDLLLLVPFRFLDDALLVAFRLVDLGVALAFGVQDDGALFALRAHLLLHGAQDVLGRIDVLDLVAQHLDAPGRGSLVEFGDDILVDRLPLFEGAVELDLADLAAERRLRELDDREAVVGDAVGCLAGLQHLQIQHSVHADLHVVPGDADLLRDVHRLFLQVVLVGDALDERDEDMKARLDRAAVAAEILDDKRALLRHDNGGLRDDDDREQRDHPDDIHGFHG